MMPRMCSGIRPRVTLASGPRSSAHWRTPAICLVRHAARPLPKSAIRSIALVYGPSRCPTAPLSGTWHIAASTTCFHGQHSSGTRRMCGGTLWGNPAFVMDDTSLSEPAPGRTHVDFTTRSSRSAATACRYSAGTSGSPAASTSHLTRWPVGRSVVLAAAAKRSIHAAILSAPDRGYFGVYRFFWVHRLHCRDSSAILNISV